MASYPNFYENVEEANFRLQSTIILYDDEPYYFLTAADHKDDGIMRAYLDPLPADPSERPEHYNTPVPYTWYEEYEITRGEKMDQYLEQNKGKTKIIRKMMNSPKFKKFRPFPLGMCNLGLDCWYVQRQPRRSHLQGLCDEMLYSKCCSLNEPKSKYTLSGARPTVGVLYNTIKGIYPSYEECYENFRQGNISNNSVGFHREFAISKGPVGILCLVYKEDTVGVITGKKSLQLSNEFHYTREVIEELNIFDSIGIQGA